MLGASPVVKSEVNFSGSAGRVSAFRAMFEALLHISRCEARSETTCGFVIHDRTQRQLLERMFTVKIANHQENTRLTCKHVASRRQFSLVAMRSGGRIRGGGVSNSPWRSRSRSLRRGCETHPKDTTACPHSLLICEQTVIMSHNSKLVQRRITVHCPFAR
jgi:hypothetical protein